MKKLTFKLRLLILSLLAWSSTIASPHNVVIVDTGYDACKQQQGQHCEYNKNILVRGSQPGLQDKFDLITFRQQILQAMTEFNKTYHTQATLPLTSQDLQNYRIVIINLLYGYGGEDNGKNKELSGLMKEFQFSGVADQSGIPEQHKIYGLTVPFHPDIYAFEWWPITLQKANFFAPRYTVATINWPDKNPTPEHNYLPQIYKPMDLPYLLTGQFYANYNKENEAMSIPELLNTAPIDHHPLLIFYHCVAGKDRTGVVTMAYYMTYGGYPTPHTDTTTPPVRRSQMSRKQALQSSKVGNETANGRAQRLAKCYEQWLLAHRYVSSQ